MAYKIENHLTTVNKGKKGDNKPEWIIVHFVGAAGQVLANMRYFASIYRGASAHYFVDPERIGRLVEDDTPAWHIGDGHRTRQGKNNGYVHRGGATNTNAIGIEGCQDTSTGKDVWNWDFHPETIKKINWLVKDLQKKYNIDDDHVIRHFDASGKLCPGNWSHNSWAKWWEFKNDLVKDIKQATPSAGNKPEGKLNEEGMYLIEAGDTLSSIAKKHNVSVNNLVLWNDLEDPNLIFPETKIFVKDPKVFEVEVKTDIQKLARDVIAGKHGTGDARRKSLGKDYDAVQAEVNRILTGGSSQPKPTPKPASKTIDQLAQEVIDGKHGTGDARRKSLGSQFDAVQKRVNERLGGPKPSTPVRKTIDQLAKEVIDGRHGSGEARKRSLGAQFDAVQKRVNEILGTPARSSSKSIKQLADEVMRGSHGSGRERMISLGANYAAVQAEVNKRLKK